MTEHVLLVGREEGLARRYRQHGAGAVSVLCRTEHVSRVEGFSEDGEHVFVAIARKYSDPVTFYSRLAEARAFAPEPERARPDRHAA